MKKLIILIIVMGPIFLSAQSLEIKIVEAIKDVANEDFTSAISKYDTLIQEHPNLPILYLLKGEAYSQLKRTYSVDTIMYLNALQCFDQALALDTTLFEAHSSKGVLNIFHQRFDRAVTDFTKAVQYAPTEEDLFNSLTDRGAAHLFLNNHQEAIDDYKKALELNPNAASVYANLAMLYKRKGDLVKARDISNKALSFAPEDETFLNNSGLIYEESGNLTEAMTVYNKVLSINPENPQVLSNRGSVQTKLGKYELAMQDLNQSIKIYPENSFAFKNRSKLFFAMKKKVEGCTDLKEAERLGYSKMYGDEVKELVEKNCQ